MRRIEKKSSKQNNKRTNIKNDIFARFSIDEVSRKELQSLLTELNQRETITSSQLNSKITSLLQNFDSSPSLNQQIVYLKQIGALLLIILSLLHN